MMHVGSERPEETNGSRKNMTIHISWIFVFRNSLIDPSYNTHSDIIKNESTTILVTGTNCATPDNEGKAACTAKHSVRENDENSPSSNHTRFTDKGSDLIHRTGITGNGSNKAISTDRFNGTHDHLVESHGTEVGVMLNDTESTEADKPGCARRGGPNSNHPDDGTKCPNAPDINDGP